MCQPEDSSMICQSIKRKGKSYFSLILKQNSLYIKIEDNLNVVCLVTHVIYSLDYNIYLFILCSFKSLICTVFSILNFFFIKEDKHTNKLWTKWIHISILYHFLWIKWFQTYKRCRFKKLNKCDFDVLFYLFYSLY